LQSLLIATKGHIAVAVEVHDRDLSISNVIGPPFGNPVGRSGR